MLGLNNLNTLLSTLESAQSFNTAQVEPWLLDFNNDLKQVEINLELLKTDLTAQFETLKNSQDLIRTLEEQRQMLIGMINQIPHYVFENSEFSEQLIVVEPKDVKLDQHEIIKPTTELKEIKEKKKVNSLKLLSKSEFDLIPK
jgi:hypothetical protein